MQEFAAIEEMGQSETSKCGRSVGQLGPLPSFRCVELGHWFTSSFVAALRRVESWPVGFSFCVELARWVLRPVGRKAPIAIHGA